MSEYVVPALPVFWTNAFHVDPPLFDLSILYPVIGEPPLFEGAFHIRLICDDDAAAAARFSGWDGAVTDVVVADAAFDGELVPMAFMADTL